MRHTLFGLQPPNRVIVTKPHEQLFRTAVKNQLKEIGSSPLAGAWEMLFKDPDDGRYWERTYPQGEMHGGGSPELRCLSPQDAAAKYDLS